MSSQSVQIASKTKGCNGMPVCEELDTVYLRFCLATDMAIIKMNAREEIEKRKPVSLNLSI
jgi:hypothetical protein